MDERIRAALYALDEEKIPYTLIEHGPAFTMELCAGIGSELGARHCKNLFLTNKHGNNVFLLLTDPDKPYRTSVVSKLLGSTRLSFASQEQLGSVLGAVQGSVSIMALVTDEARKAYSRGMLHIAIDSSLLSQERICVHPNADTATLVLETKDLLEFVRRRGFSVTVADI